MKMTLFVAVALTILAILSTVFILLGEPVAGWLVIVWSLIAADQAVLRAADHWGDS